VSSFLNPPWGPYLLANRYYIIREWKKDLLDNSIYRILKALVKTDSQVMRKLSQGILREESFQKLQQMYV
jgi:hypothetical protein